MMVGPDMQLGSQVNYPRLQSGACSYRWEHALYRLRDSTSPPMSGERTAIGWLTTALAAIFLAAFRSAFSVCPHSRQRNAAWVGRLSGWTNPQPLHCWLVRPVDHLHRDSCPASLVLDEGSELMERPLVASLALRLRNRGSAGECQ